MDLKLDDKDIMIRTLQCIYNISVCSISRSNKKYYLGINMSIMYKTDTYARVCKTDTYYVPII